MSTPDEADLRAHIAELERENAALRAAVRQPTQIAPAIATRPARQRGRSIGSAIVIVVALLLTPVAIVAGFAKHTLTDTDAFVATFAPLADDPSVQATVQDAVVAAIEDAVDIPGLTSQAFDGLEGLDLPDRATAALRLLEGPAVQGIRSTIRQVVDQFVRSESFSNVWRQTLAVSHAQMVATMTDAAGTAVSITTEGGLELNLGPIVSEVRSRLVDTGIGLAASIPDVDRTIVLVQSDAIRQAKVGYALVVGVGTWLPWVTLLLLGAGVLAASRRRAALLRTGVALAALMVLLWGAISFGRVIAVGEIASGGISRATATVLYDTGVDAILRATAAIGVLGVTIAVVAFLSGPSRIATGVRTITADAAASVRAAGQQQGLSTGAVGRALERFHAVAVAVLIGIGTAVIALVRPLTVGVVLWTLVPGLLAVLVLQLLRTPAPAVEPPAAEPAAVGPAAVEPAPVEPTRTT